MPRFSIKRKKKEPEPEPEPEQQTQPATDESMEMDDEEYESTSEEENYEEEEPQDDNASLVAKTAQLKLEPTGGPQIQAPSQRGGAKFARQAQNYDKYRQSWGFGGMGRRANFGQPRSAFPQNPHLQPRKRRGLQYRSIYGPNSDSYDVQTRAKILYARAFG